MPVRTWMDTTIASTTLAGNQTDPDAAVFPDGGYVVVWVDVPSGDIIGRYFKPMTTPYFPVMCGMAAA